MYGTRRGRSGHRLIKVPSPLDRHGRETRQFLIFTDFEVIFEDHNGVTGTIPTIPATRENIVRHNAVITRHKA